MKRAGHPVILQESARGDHLGLEREVPGPLHLTEIWRLAGAHQGLQAPLALGAHDLDLQIPAAGGGHGVVGRTAGGGGAGVVAVHDRERVGGWRRMLEGPRHQPFRVHDAEPVLPQTAELCPVRRPSGRRAFESVNPATGRHAILSQMTAGYVEHGVHVEVILVGPGLAEGDLLRVPQQPGRLVIEGGGAIFQRADAQGDAERAAV